MAIGGQQTQRQGDDIKGTVVGIITGIVLIVIGAIMSNITMVIGTYIQTEIGRGINMTNITPIVPTERVAIVGTALVIAGITIIVFAAVFMLRQLMSLSQGLEAGRAT